MNPRIPYNPNKRRPGQGDDGGGCLARLFWLSVPALALAFVWAVRTGGLGSVFAALGVAPVNPAAATATPVPPSFLPTVTGFGTATEPVPTDLPLPTSTQRPAPSPSPTALSAAAATAA